MIHDIAVFFMRQHLDYTAEEEEVVRVEKERN